MPRPRLAAELSGGDRSLGARLTTVAPCPGDRRPWSGCREASGPSTWLPWVTNTLPPKAPSPAHPVTPPSVTWVRHGKGLGRGWGTRVCVILFGTAALRVAASADRRAPNTTARLRSAGHATAGPRGHSIRAPPFPGSVQGGKGKGLPPLALRGCFPTCPPRGPHQL